MPPEGSVTQWIRQLKAGEQGAVEKELFDRYFIRLAALARSKLGSLPRKEADEEDIAALALNSFFTAAKQGRFSDLRDRTSLWALLAKITMHKLFDEKKRQTAQKRGAGNVRGESAFDHASDAAERRIEAVLSKEPSPESVVAFTEMFDRLINDLNDETLRTIAQMNLENYTNAEVAATLSVSERTIERKLSRIRQEWQAWSERDG